MNLVHNCNGGSATGRITSDCQSSATWEVLTSQGDKLFYCDLHIRFHPIPFGTATKIR